MIADQGKVVNTNYHDYALSYFNSYRENTFLTQRTVREKELDGQKQSRSWEHAWRSFCKTTTIHGLHYAVDNTPFLIRR